MCGGSGGNFAKAALVAAALAAPYALPALGAAGAGAAGGGFLGALKAAAPNILGSLAAGAATGALSGQPEMPQAPALPQEKPFSPTKPKELAAPESITGGEFAGLGGGQLSSALATKGLYGGGLGEQEQEYYLNQLQQNIFDPQGNVGDIGNLGLLPVESSYLGSLGIPTSSSMDFLRAIQQGSVA